MGRPKLILPLGDETVIARVSPRWSRAEPRPCSWSFPPASASGAITLAEEAERAGAVVVVAAATRRHARLDRAGARPPGQGPSPDAVLIAPGDSPASPPRWSPGSSSGRCRARTIVVPAYRGRRGHPIALPWRLAAEVKSLPKGVGLNALVARHAADVVEFEVDEPGTVVDLDTPEDYQHWTGASQGRSW